MPRRKKTRRAPKPQPQPESMPAAPGEAAPAIQPTRHRDLTTLIEDALIALPILLTAGAIILVCLY